jgi:integrase
MATVRLTHRGIAGLTAGRWLTDYWDDRLTGFGVRVTHSGAKSYVVRYAVNGRRRRQVLGHYPALALADARDKAKGILYAVDRGEDPQAEKQADREAITVGELAAEYIERHAKQKKRRWKEDQRMLRVDVLPHWKRRPAKSITRRDVSELLDGIVERGAPIMANRVKALVSKMFNFGIGRDLVETNPCTGVPMPAKARQRDRVLSDDEIRRIWRVLDKQGKAMAASFKLRLITAQRGVEVLMMRWEDIDGDWWTIPAEVSKNGRSHRVPLSAPALALLEELRVAADESQWVFPSPKGGDRPIGYVQKAAEKLVEATGVEFVPHDLRRTAASAMTSMGVPRLVVSKILNHVESGVTAIYDRHSYDGEKREALARWGERIEEVLTQNPAPVLAAGGTSVFPAGQDSP